MKNKSIKKVNDKHDVGNMFDSIAPSYDFLNHFLSLGTDRYWRNSLRKELRKYHHKTILDVATGTADLAICLSKLNTKITAVDISEKMLDIAKRKLQKKNIKNVKIKYGNGENLAFDTQSFDAITISFGIRNFNNPENGIQEFKRLLKPKGKLYILEFSKSKYSFVRFVFGLYFHKIMPFIGKLISKNNYAYKYLPDSVDKFYYGSEFIDLIKMQGFDSVEEKKLSFGITSLYVCEI